MVLRSATSSPRSPASFLRARAQFGHHRSEQHGGAQRLQRVLRPHQQRRRRAPSGALQGGQHLDNLGTARIERAADLLLAGVERAQPRFGVADLGLDAAHLGGDVDQLLIELAAVLSDRRDVGLELLLHFGGALLLRAGGFEFLLALLDGVGRGGGRGLRRRCAATCAAAGEQARCRQSRRTTARSTAESALKQADRGGRCQGTIECPDLAASRPNQCLRCLAGAAYAR